eukprot:TRINITY_DN10580_c0_g1_i1.p1 TRINITY_DN10580_c0_g1~~TRINITY_DN10580_c0_g1_i1.p1  ORF type:complete len:425 (+),score=62.91 TRINITY_DN10580_c0_g1_i1:40-1314(+)
MRASACFSHRANIAKTSRKRAAESIIGHTHPSSNMALFILALAFCATLTPVESLNNGLGRTPPMGFNTWNVFGITSRGTPKLPGSHGANESVIKAIADAFVQRGLAKAGYHYVNLDCGYSTGFRNASGYLQVNRTLYPSGLKALAEYIHSQGLKFGIYSDAGPQQCCSRIYPSANDGSAGYEDKDAAWFASLGVDYLKHDDCGSQASSYPHMRDALNKTGRPIYYSIHGPSGQEAVPLSNCWRTTHDIDTKWSTIMDRIHTNDQYADVVQPGAFNDPDMLEVGNAPLSMPENRAHFSLWCLAKAPLLIGTDLTKVSDAVIDILANPEAIAINQDPLAKQGRLISNTSQQELWSGPLSNGDVAVVLLNAVNASQVVSFDISALPEDKGRPWTIRRIWTRETLPPARSFSTRLDGHDVAFLRLSQA